MDGRNLKELLIGKQASTSIPVISSLGTDKFSVRQEEWHYINYGTNEEELYNLSSDPNEWTNLASDTSYFTIKSQLRNQLPKDLKELVKTAPIRWEDVLSGKVSFY